MTCEIYNYNDFPLILDKHTIPMPAGLAMIPLNVEESNHQNEWIYHESSKDLHKVLKAATVDICKLDNSSGSSRYLHQHSADWIGPTIFIGANILIENPYLISVALGVISNYVTDLFQGKLNKPTFKMELVIETEKNKSYKKLIFEGEPQNIDKIIKAIKSLK